MECGAGKKKRWLPIHAYPQHLDEQKRLTLLFWYAFTGCDTVSNFNGRGEKTASEHFLGSNVWKTFPEITDFHWALLHS